MRAPSGENAERELVREVGGYTLVLELIVAYLAVRAEEGAAPSQYLGVLHRKGLAITDALGDQHSETAGHVEHEQKQMATVLDNTLEELPRGFAARG